jgi:hypothetical protein
MGFRHSITANVSYNSGRYNIFNNLRKIIYNAPIYCCISNINNQYYDTYLFLYDKIKYIFITKFNFQRCLLVSIGDMN